MDNSCSTMAANREHSGTKDKRCSNLHSSTRVSFPLSSRACSRIATVSGDPRYYIKSSLQCLSNSGIVTTS